MGRVLARRSICRHGRSRQRRRFCGTPRPARSLRSFDGHTAAVTAATFSPDGKRIATGSADKNVKVWDVNMGTDLLTLRSHADEVTVVRFSRTGRMLLSAGRDGGAILWPTFDWRPVAAPPKP